MSTDDPTYEEVKATVRRALYHELKAREFASQLAWWGLPATPDALSIAAERAYSVMSPTSDPTGNTQH